MKLTDQQFKKLMEKIAVKSENKVSDEQFKLLLSKAKVYKRGKNNSITFKKIPALPVPKKEIAEVKEIEKAPSFGMYEKMLDLVGSVIQRKPKTIIKKIIEKENVEWQNIEGLAQIISELQRKVRAYERYNEGGPGLVFHDSTLSGSGVPGDPLSVIISSSINLETPTGQINGSNVTFTVTHIPTFIVLNGVTYFENDGYTRVGLTLTLLVVPATGSTLRSFY